MKYLFFKTATIVTSFLLFFASLAIAKENVNSQTLKPNPNGTLPQNFLYVTTPALASTSEHYLRAYSSITLGIDHDVRQFVRSEFANGYRAVARFQVKYRLYGDAVTDPLRDAEVELAVDFDPLNTKENALLSDRNMYLIENAVDINVSYLSLNLYAINSSTQYPLTYVGGSMVVPNNLNLTVAITTNKTIDISPSTLVTPISHTAVNVGGTADPDVLAISWPIVNQAEEYELEWTFVDFNQGVKTFDFVNNSTRVRIKQNAYELPLNYEKGYIYYRVRPLGIRYPLADRYLAGSWSAPDNGILPSTSANVYLVNDHERSKNWQFTATYAEEGKKKEVISYFDGTNRDRQVATKINTDKNAIVGEQIYDHHGRPAVQILPVPTQDNVLGYHNQFNKSAANTSREYSKLDFDLDAANCVSPTGPVANVSGAGRYYSPVNTDQSAQQAFVPDAFGYPFSQTEFKADNTSRPKRVTMPGDEMLLGKGHETRYMYAQPEQEELDRLFGSEAGFADQYSTLTTIDPNGQISIAYKDSYDRTVATALAGDAAPGIDLLPSNTGSSRLNVNLFSSSPSSQSSSNVVAPSGDALVFSKTISVSKNNTSYDFHYIATLPQYLNQCTPQLCFDCVYDLEISIKDECGAEVIPGGPKHYTLGSLTFDTQCANQITFEILPADLTLLLNTGEYKLVKTLSVNKDALNYYMDQHVLNGCNGIKTETTIFNELLATSTSNNCDANCADCLASIGPRPAAGDPALKEWLENEAACQDLCVTPGQEVDVCAASYRALLQDVRPLGQYCEYVIDNTTGEIINDDTKYPLSLLSSGNRLPSNINSGQNAYWRKPKYYDPATGNFSFKYKDASNQEAKIEVKKVASGYEPALLTGAPVIYSRSDANGDEYYLADPESLATLNDFVLLYLANPSWATSLVTYHPEFCYYMWCSGNSKTTFNNMSSLQFDNELQKTTDYLDAQSKGFFNVNNYYSLLDKDPYFNGSGQGATQKGIMILKLANFAGSGQSVMTAAIFSCRCQSVFEEITDPALLSQCGAYTNSDLPCIWANFKTLYLAEKTKLQNKTQKEYAIANKCYNGCIGKESFDPYSEPQFVSCGPFFQCSYYVSIPASACYLLYKDLYKEKEVRYTDPMSYVGLNPDDDDQEYLSRLMNEKVEKLYYQKTGQTPTEVSMEVFLNHLVQKDKLKSAANLQMISFPGFTKALYDALKAPNQNPGYIPYQWSSSATGKVITGIFSDNTGTPDPECGTIKVTLSANVNYNWSDIVTIKRLYKLKPYTITGTGIVYSASMEVTTNILNHEKETIGVLVEACGNLIGNSYNGTICNLTSLGQSVQEFLSAVYSQGYHNSNFSNFNTENLFTQIFSKIELYKLFPASAQFSYYASSVNDPFYSTADLNVTAVAGGLTDEFKFHIDNYGPLDFSNVKSIQLLDTYVSGAQTTGAGTYSATLKIAIIPVTGKVIETYATISITLASAALKMELFDCKGDGTNPGSFECENSMEAKNIGSLESFFSAFLKPATGEHFAISSSLNTNIAFTERLKTQLGDIYQNYSWVVSPSPTAAQILMKIRGIDAMGHFKDLCTFTLANPGLLDLSSVVAVESITPDYSSLTSQTGVTNDFILQLKLANGSIASFKVNSCFSLTNCVTCPVTATNNLIVNGDFENGNTGFTTALPLYTPTGTNCQVIWESLIAKFNMGQTFYTVFSGCLLGKDHTLPGSGKYYFSNKNVLNPVIDQTPNWSQTVTVKPNTTYRLSFWRLILGGQLGSGILGAPFYKYFITVKINGDVVLAKQLPKGINAGSNLIDNFWAKEEIEWLSNQSTTAAIEIITTVYDPTRGGALAYNITGLDDISMIESCEPLKFNPDFPVVDINDIDPDVPCEEERRAHLQILAHEIFLQQTEKVEEEKARYIAHCLKALQEGMDYTYDFYQYHYTLYYYDRAGNVMRTVPPAGVKPITSTAQLAQVRDARNSNTVSILPQHSLSTTYKYNSANQLVEQNTPDAGITKFWYDLKGRLVLSQNAKQAINESQAVGGQRFTFSKYDEQGRIIENGEVAYEQYAGGTFHAPQVNTTTLNAPNFPLSIAPLLGVNERIRKRQVVRTLYDKPYSTVASVISQRNLRGRVSAITLDEDGNGVYEHGSFYSYDIHGNVYELAQDHAYLRHFGNGQHFKKVNYEYDLVSGNVNKVFYQLGKPDLLVHRYEYDADNRITSVSTSRDGYLWDKDARYNFYKHGSLARTELGNEKVQGLDYTYTLQGWLKGINAATLRGTVNPQSNRDPGLDGNNDNSGALAYEPGQPALHAFIPPDVTGFTLNYFNSGTGDYSPISSNTNRWFTNNRFEPVNGPGLLTLASANLYNGNIRRMITALEPGNGVVNGSALTNWALFRSGSQAHAFTYDQLNRIKKGEIFLAPPAGNNTTLFTPSLGLRSSYDYDANGNLVYLQRKNEVGTNMDNLIYNYTWENPTAPIFERIPVSNRLRNVSDGVGTSLNGSDIGNQPIDNYSYDGIGNLVGDLSEEIERIDWNVFGKIMAITRIAGSKKSDLEFHYDAMGNRVLKIEKPPLPTINTNPLKNPRDLWVFTHYVRDAQGNVMAIYTETVKDKIAINPGGANLVTRTSLHSLILDEQPIYGSSRVGEIRPHTFMASQQITTSRCNVCTTCTRPNCLVALASMPASSMMLAMAMYDSPLTPNGILAKEINQGEFFMINNQGPLPMSLKGYQLRNSKGEVLPLDPNVVLPVGHNYLAINGTPELRERFSNFTGLTNEILNNQNIQVGYYSGFAMPDAGLTITLEYVLNVEDNTALILNSLSYGLLQGQVIGPTAPNGYNNGLTLQQGNNVQVLVYHPCAVLQSGNSNRTASSPVAANGLIGTLLSRVLDPLTGVLGSYFIQPADYCNPQPPDKTLTDYAGIRTYEITDHLGNVLTTISDKHFPRYNILPSPLPLAQNIGILGYRAHVLGMTDYYPFGMQMPGRVANAGDYRFGFNGKENDNEVKGTGNQQDYGYRIYDPRLGRFMSVDPLTRKFPMLTPYQFASNNPILNIDLDGLEGYSSLERIAKEMNGYKISINKETGNSIVSKTVVYEQQRGGTDFSPTVHTKSLTTTYNINEKGEVVNAESKVVESTIGYDRSNPTVLDRKESNKTKANKSNDELVNAFAEYAGQHNKELKDDGDFPAGLLSTGDKTTNFTKDVLPVGTGFFSKHVGGLVSLLLEILPDSKKEYDSRKIKIEEKVKITEEIKDEMK